MLLSSTSLPDFGLFWPQLKVLWGVQASHSIHMVLVGPQLTHPFTSKTVKKAKNTSEKLLLVF